MRIIPVMDLRGGIVVHAFRGERARYRPLESIVTDSPEPLAVARALRERFHFTDLYAADLDALEGRPLQEETLRRLVRWGGMRLWVDAGVGDIESARRLLAIGVDRVIVASETLRHPAALADLGDGLPPERRVFSLDLQHGRVLSPMPSLAGESPLKALELVRTAGWSDVIVLDLTRVGTGSGPDTALVAEIRRQFPELRVFVGGGIGSASDLHRLADLGVEGVLVATALHTGRLGPVA